MTAASRDPGPAPSVRLRPLMSPSSALRRERLLRRLDRAPGMVTLVCGHAGAGKTTLAADWATTRIGDGGVVAWYGLDRFDDDPARLWEGILAALRAERTRVRAAGETAPWASRITENTPPGATRSTRRC